jgi:hypothetical protein
MSDAAIASYTFLPWLRSGLASLAHTVPVSDNHRPLNHLALQVALAVNNTASPSVPVRVHGPGQVTGIDPRAILRMDPSPDTATFEPNYFPAVEFATPDFPWLFTPDLASGVDRSLRPWLCLVVIREQPGVALVPRGNRPDIPRSRLLPLLQFKEPAVPLDELPNLDQIASWAHVQIIGAPAADDDTVRSALAGSSSAYVSRIICPRKLEPLTSYIACLVPTYNVGVTIGVSPDLPIDEEDVSPAWGGNVGAPSELPVYASWRFSTSATGDFASLAQAIRPPKEPLQLGLRDMDVSAPGFGLPEFPGLVLKLEGALRSSDAIPSSWPAGVQERFEQALRPILSPDPALSTVPLITPPAYASVPTGQPLPPPGGAPLWMRELNFDPRWRATAAMGGKIVRADQEALMASAWDQYEAVRRANQLLRQMQLARAVTGATRTRHFGAVDGPGTLLQLTRPLHARLQLDPSSRLTLAAQIGASRIAAGAVSPAFRRLARRLGPVGRILYAPVGPSAAPTGMRLIERLNAAPGSAGALTVLSPRSPPRGTVLLDAVSPATTLTDLTPTVVSRAAGWSADKVPTDALAVGGGSGGDQGGGSDGDGSQNPRMSPAMLRAIREFGAAAADVATYITAQTTGISDPPEDPPLPTPLPLLQRQIFEALDPAVTILARARARLTLPTQGDPLRPQLVTPVFPRAMSRELTPQQLLPGVERVPPNTAALLVTNRSFIEAFMVGLNDEMRRELAWRQYPTDQRGTFFTHFWDKGAGAAAPEGDIPPIAAWSPSHHLGDNATVQGEQVVFLLRGELLRRYPNTIISAVQAQAGPNNLRTLGSKELFPVFRGAIPPDMVFFGFALSKEEATANEGWYFVLAEHPTEPRFGFEPVAKTLAPTIWNDLAWVRADGSPEVAVLRNHVDLSAPAPSPPLGGAAWNGSAAQQAFIALRTPVRVALHASVLLG